MGQGVCLGRDASVGLGPRPAFAQHLAGRAVNEMRQRARRAVDGLVDAAGRLAGRSVQPRPRVQRSLRI